MGLNELLVEIHNDQHEQCQHEQWVGSHLLERNFEMILILNDSFIIFVRDMSDYMYFLDSSSPLFFSEYLIF